MFDVLTESIEYIRAGRLRPLAVTTAARSEALPDLPTVGDFVRGYEASAWFGLGESWPRKSGQEDRWSLCLTAGTLCPTNQEAR
jgi:hypothetical protein